MSENITNALAVIGAISSLLTLLGAVLPQSWGITQVCARYGATIRQTIGGGK